MSEAILKILLLVILSLLVVFGYVIFNIPRIPGVEVAQITPILYYVGIGSVMLITIFSGELEKRGW